MLKFISALLKFDFDVILDLHNVIRTIIICTFFRLNGKRVFVLDKARKERKRLTAIKGNAMILLSGYSPLCRCVSGCWVELYRNVYISL